MKKLICLSLMFVSLAAFAQKPYEYSLSAGDKFEVSVDMVQNIEQNVMGQSAETQQDVNSVDLFEVLSVSNGIYTIKSTAISRKVSISAPMMSMEMNSDGEAQTDLPFKVMAGKTFQFTMNKKGEVLQVMGLDKVRAAMKDELAGTPFAAQVDQLTATYQDEFIKGTLDSQFNIYPKTKQDTWDKSVSLVMNNAPVETVVNFAYTGANQITGTGDVTMKGEQEQMGMTVSSDLSGKQSSVFDIDAKTGLPAKVTVSQDVSGNMSAQGMDIPMKLKTNATTSITMK